MTSRKEQKEALRREREERERQQREAQARKRMVGFGAAGVLVLAAVIVLVVVLAGGGDGDASADVLPDGGNAPEQRINDMDEAVAAAGCKIESKRARSRQHTQDPNEDIEYPDNPPTSGRHYELPADDGAYSDAPREEELVHTMEHGRMILWFKPSLPTDARADLYDLFNEDDGYQMAMVPRQRMPYDVAVTVWSREPEPNGTGRLLSCPRYNDRIFDAIRTFRDEYRGDGPEPVP